MGGHPSGPRTLADPMLVSVLLPRFRDGKFHFPLHTPFPKDPPRTGAQRGVACSEAHGMPPVCFSWAEMKLGENLSQALY